MLFKWTAKNNYILGSIRIITADDRLILITSVPCALSAAVVCGGGMASCSDKVVYLHESVVRGHHVYKCV